MSEGRKLVARACVAIAATVLVLTGTAAGATALVVTDMNNGTTAQDLANSLVGTGVTVSNVTYTGPGNSAGLFSGGTATFGFDSGIVMGSGSVQTTATSTACNKGVEGPNECDGNTTANGTGGDADLNALSGVSTYDAAVLEIDFVPQFSSIQFQYVFSSDEYNEYANTIFNDAFGFFVNGTNCATVPVTGEPVTINTINMGNPGGDPTPHNAHLYRNNDLQDGGGLIDTEMDGLTVTLTCSATVNAGVTNHMKLAIADGSDSVLDSNVFLKGGSLISGTVITTSLSGDGQSGPAITVSSGSSVVDSATLSGANSATAGGTVTYTVYSDATCTTVFASAGTKTVTAGVVPDSDAVVFTAAGTYYWVASYSGDTLNNPSASACGSESVTISSPPPPPPPSGPCKVTGGGVLLDATGRATFGLNARTDGTKASGNVQYQDHGIGTTVKSVSITKVSCNGNAATIEGTASVNGGAATSFTIHVTDSAEPGRTDLFSITVGTYSRSDSLEKGGNIQVHKS